MFEVILSWPYNVRLKGSLLFSLSIKIYHKATCKDINDLCLGILEVY